MSKFITLDVEDTMYSDVEKYLVSHLRSREENTCVADCQFEYYGHDHKNDYEKCTVCGYMREVE